MQNCFNKENKTEIIKYELRDKIGNIYADSVNYEDIAKAWNKYILDHGSDNELSTYLVKTSVDKLGNKVYEEYAIADIIKAFKS